MKFLLVLILTTSATMTTFAKKENRKPSSVIGCDKSQVSRYVSEKMNRYQDMLKEGKLSAEDVQSLINTVSDSVEMNALGCGWINLQEKKELDFCTQAKVSQTRWYTLELQGAISAEEKKSLLAALAALAQMKNVSCK